MLKVALAAALAAAASAIPSGPSHHQSTPGGTVVELRVPAGQLEAVEAISHDIWTTRYSPGNLSATHLDLNVHVAHEQLAALRQVHGAEQLGVLVDDVHTLVDAEAAKLLEPHGPVVGCCRRLLAVDCCRYISDC